MSTFIHPDTIAHWNEQYDEWVARLNADRNALTEEAMQAPLQPALSLPEAIALAASPGGSHVLGPAWDSYRACLPEFSDEAVDRLLVEAGFTLGPWNLSHAGDESDGDAEESAKYGPGAGFISGPWVAELDAATDDEDTPQGDPAAPVITPDEGQDQGDHVTPPVPADEPLPPDVEDSPAMTRFLDAHAAEDEREGTREMTAILPLPDVTS